MNTPATPAPQSSVDDDAEPRRPEGMAVPEARPPEAARRRRRLPRAAAAPLRRRLRAVLEDRRGATALVFAGSAVALFGFAALATEGGLWYAVHRDARSAADMAAMGGASSHLYVPNDQARARAVAMDTAARNGFSNDAQTSVVVNSPAASGPNAGVAKSVEVIVTRRVPTSLSALFLGQPEMSISVRATALVFDSQTRACILATRTGLVLRGNTSINASNCVMHSNKPGSGSTSRQGQSMYLNLAGLTATGQCIDCNYTGNGSNVETHGSGKPPVEDPFDWANDVPMPPSLSCSPTNLVDWPRVTDPRTGQQTLRVVGPSGAQYAGAPYRVFCGNQSLEGQQGGGTGTWDFAPGTYYFTGNFSVKTAILTCSTCVPGVSGVTIVMAGVNGATPGALSFSAQSVVRLNAPPGGPYPGLLIYRDDAGTAAASQIQLTAGGDSSLVGGIYGPSSGIYYAGNNKSEGVNRGCFVMVGDFIDIAGGSGSVQYNDCDRVGTGVPRLRVVRLVE